MVSRRHGRIGLAVAVLMLLVASVAAAAGADVGAREDRSLPIELIAWERTTPYLVTFIQGETAPGATVWLAANGVPVGEVSADAFGLFLFTDVPLRDGDNRLQLTATDAAGRVGERVVEVKAGRYTDLDWIGFVTLEAGHRSGGGALPATAIDLGDGLYLDLQTAFYVRGVVAGVYQVTVGYDHAGKSERLALERSEEDGAYPILGDASTIELDAVSRERLYVRVQSGPNYVLYGDYQTQLVELELAPYNRMLTGPRLLALVPVGEQGRLTLTLMGASNAHVSFSDLLPARGTPGFYQLTHDNVVLHSEQVVIVTLDPNNPGTPLRVRPMVRDVDYHVDYEAGTLLFKQPIPVQDAYGNQNFIAVRYEYIADGGAQSARAGRIAYQTVSGWTLGLTRAEEHGSNTSWVLTGFDTAYAPSQRLRASLQVAHSRHEAGTINDGTAYKLEIAGDLSATARYRLFHRETQPTFAMQPGDLPFAGSRRTGAEVTATPTEALGVTLKLTAGSDDQPVTGVQSEMQAASVEAAYRSGPWRLTGRLESGRITRAGAGPDRLQTSGGAIGVEYDLGTNGKLGAFREVAFSESLVTGNTSQTGATGVRYDRQITDRTDWTMGYSLADSGTHGAWVGVASRIQESANVTTTVYTRYQLDGAIGALRAQSAVGLNNRWQITPEFSTDVSYEKTRDQGDPVPRAEDTLAPPAPQEALSVAVSYVPVDRFRLSARYSAWQSADGSQRLTEVSGVGLLGRDVSLLLKAIWAEGSAPDGSALRRRLSQSLGLAYRPVDSDRINGLLRYERSTTFRPPDPGFSLPAESERQIVSGELSWWLTSRLEAAAKLARRHVVESVPPAPTVTSVTDLYQGRLTLVLSQRFDVNGVYRRLHQHATGVWQTGYQLSLGYRLLAADPRWRLEFGYRYADYAPEEDPSDEAFVMGPFVRLTFRF